MNEITRDISILTKKSEDFNFQSPQRDPHELAVLLLEIMNKNNGLGLSAIQLDIPLKVFIMRSVPEAFVCFNPKLVMPSSETIKLDEACLSFPGLVLPIKRPQHVRVRFAGPDGSVHTHTFTGMTARCFQHELDHCDGKLFFQGCSRFHLERAVKHAKSNGHDYIGLMKYAKR